MSKKETNSPQTEIPKKMVRFLPRSGFVTLLITIIATLAILPHAAVADDASDSFEAAVLSRQKAVLAEPVWEDVPALTLPSEAAAPVWDVFSDSLPRGQSASLAGDEIVFECDKARLIRRTWTQGKCKTEAYVWMTELVQWPLALLVEGLDSAAGRSGADSPAVSNFLFSVVLRGAEPGTFAVRSPVTAVKRSDAVVGEFSGRLIASHFDESLLFWIDDEPRSNWGHATRYVFAAPDLSGYAVYFGTEPIRVERENAEMPMELLFGAEEEPDAPSPDEIRSGIENAFPAANAISYSGDASKSYAILISGGCNRYNNHTRYWGDMAAVYGTLTKQYGFQKSHIKVCMSDGTSSSSDLSYGTSGSQSHSAFGSNSPTDLDGDGSSDVGYTASKSSIQSAFSSLASTLSSSDQLFVFITDHGGYDSSTGVAYLIPWLGQSTDLTSYSSCISPSELANMVSPIPCPVAVAMEFCYSGGFISRLSSQNNRAIATAADLTTSSGDWSSSSSAYMYMDPWVYHFVGAIRGYYPSVSTTPWNNGSSCNADGDSNGKVSFREAGLFAKSAIENDWYYDEIPQYRDVSGIGASFYMLKQSSGSSRPANDDFANALSISGSSGSASGSNVNATTQTGEPAPTAQSNSGASVWWRWTAPGNGSAVFDTNGSSFDTVLAIYTGSSVSALSHVTSDDDGGSGNNASRCSFTVTSGTTYRISVRGYSSNTGSISLHWSFTASASTTAPTAPTGVTASDGTYSDKVLVSWNASSGATSYTVYRATSSSGTKSTLGSTASTSWNDTTATAGTTYCYWVKASNSAGTSGFSSYETGYRASSSSRPSNDDFGSAWSVTGSSGSSTSTTVNATRQTGEPAHYGKTTGSIWWRWTAPSSGPASFDTNGSSFDTVMAVYTGSSVGSLSEVCSDDDGGSGNNASRCSFAATSGRTYYVAVAGYSSSGTVKLNWSVPGSSTTGSSSLADAVDNDSLTFTTGGGAAWYSQTSVSHYGGDAARSGRIADDGETWLQATGASGPGIITFWWKYSSETSYDWIDFYVDGELRTGWSGDSSGWRQEAFKVGSGSHVFKWVYSKDVSIASGSDCAWIDRITWTPGTALSPVYRFYSPSYRGHFFTMDESEMLDVCDNHNWNFEGVAYFACSAQTSGTTGLYRFYSPKFRGHFYTRDYNEYYNVRYYDRNWNYENVAYYIRSSSGYGASPVYRFWSDRYKHHFYTSDYDEYYTLRYHDRNWTYENIAFYAWKTPGDYVNTMATPDAVPNPDDPSESGKTETIGTETDRKRPTDIARSGTAFARFETWTVRAADGTAIAVPGETEVGDVLVEVRVDAPDADEFSACTGVSASLPEPAVLKLTLPTGSFGATLWSATEGTVSEEPAEGSFDFDLPANGVWHWLRIRDAAEENAPDDFSLWLRATAD